MQPPAGVKPFDPALPEPGAPDKAPRHGGPGGVEAKATKSRQTSGLPRYKD
jgi:hypothetical protein